MRPRKNKRRIDPRYFLDETADRDNLTEAQDLGSAEFRKKAEKVSRYNETNKITA